MMMSILRAWLPFIPFAFAVGCQQQTPSNAAMDPSLDELAGAECGLPAFGEIAADLESPCTIHGFADDADDGLSYVSVFPMTAQVTWSTTARPFDSSKTILGVRLTPDHDRVDSFASNGAGFFELRPFDVNYTLNPTYEPLVDASPNTIECAGVSVAAGYVVASRRLDADKLAEFGLTEDDVKQQLEDRETSPGDGVPPEPECPRGSFGDFLIVD